MDHAFLAVDWGTTNRRVYRIEDGAVVWSERDNRGVATVSDFVGEAAAIRARFGDLPMLLAGMVGSNIGWQLAPYIAAPAGVPDLAANLLQIDDRTFIIPGVATDNDVMRGEEVQLLGAVAAGLVPRDAILVQPGTHCKWARVRQERIVGFTTAMTGELFALLRTHGLLASQLQGEVAVNAAFLEGVADGKRRDLAASLFGIRAGKLLGRRDDRDAAAYASGLLIGSDVAVRLTGSSNAPIFVLSGPELGNLYTAAIVANGHPANLVDSHAAFIAGVLAIGAACP